MGEMLHAPEYAYPRTHFFSPNLGLKIEASSFKLQSLLLPLAGTPAQQQAGALLTGVSVPCRAVSCCVVLQVKLDALPPTATYHRGASTDEEAEEKDMKKPQTVHS
jgi:hypothetical protein